MNENEVRKLGAKCICKASQAETGACHWGEDKAKAPEEGGAGIAACGRGQRRPLPPSLTAFWTCYFPV